MKFTKSIYPLHRKKQTEEDLREMKDLQEACVLPRSDGMTYASERLKTMQADVKAQFKEVFLELKEALEASRLLKLGTLLFLSFSLACYFS